MEQGRSFVSETVFSDPEGVKLAFLQEAVQRGFDVRLIFIDIRDVELSIARVKDRVSAGGHDVPEVKLK